MEAFYAKCYTQDCLFGRDLFNKMFQQFLHKLLLVLLVIITIIFNELYDFNGTYYLKNL